LTVTPKNNANGHATAKGDATTPLLKDILTPPEIPSENSAIILHEANNGNTLTATSMNVNVQKSVLED